jgi:hypothetical protein
MIRFVHRDANFIKRRKILLKAGGRAALAAEQADLIIDGLLQSGAGSIKEMGVGRLTKYGEARIRNCLKFDLGNGYRLIARKNEAEIVFLYIGTHDDCDRWITDNKGDRAAPAKRRNRTDAVRETALPVEPGNPEPAESEPDQYEQMIDAIDEKDLREIFHGLRGRQTG